MPEIPFVTLNIISGYKKKKTNKENNYSKTNKTLLMTTWNSQLQTDCQVRTEGDPVPSIW